ncbi:hypothetical protein K458DRAFT_178227 [Lentithecium fluviatile CBS 122367]|uniref:Uncharacterized protein n=1 Tax=Lentithecium fluviatile CBS 122367 TaxID=1168545 RepID=A0A6G1IEZ5_9PLEO|nr:hypothetical protein K458DRAFT_178227 [Lentithecium fluviatile CBS 122367]
MSLKLTTTTPHPFRQCISANTRLGNSSLPLPCLVLTTEPSVHNTRAHPHARQPKQQPTSHLTTHTAPIHKTAQSPDTRYRPPLSYHVHYTPETRSHDSLNPVSEDETAAPKAGVPCYPMKVIEPRRA